MESIYNELALYRSTNEWARTDTVFLPIYEVCDGTVSLVPTTVLSRSRSEETPGNEFQPRDESVTE